LIAFIDIRSILSSKGFFLYHIIHPEATGVSFWQKRKLRISQATGKKYGEKSVLKQNNICNHGKHIEIFEKEVIIFGKCLRLSGRMLTSFPKTQALFTPKLGSPTQKGRHFALSSSGWQEKDRALVRLTPYLVTF
jgi:hypothetical protein